MKNKRIALITSFAEYHLLKCLIPNIIDIINPDKIIISEGKMPLGPENRGFADESEFNEKWTYWGQGKVGFDWVETKSLEQEYPNLVEVRQMDYDPSLTATESYIQSITIDDFEEGDLIFCFESDSFLYEGDKEIIEEQVSQLKCGEGLSVKYVDFLETNFYTEKINIEAPKYRRFVYKFDNLKNYQGRMGNGYLTQNYPELKQAQNFFVRHCCWWRPDEYKELRFALIRRQNTGYWEDFEKGLEEIKVNSDVYAFGKKIQKATIPTNHQWDVHLPDVVIRPDRQDSGRYAQFIDVPHPKHIKNHPNYCK